MFHHHHPVPCPGGRFAAKHPKLALSFIFTVHWANLNPVVYLVLYILLKNEQHELYPYEPEM